MGARTYQMLSGGAACALLLACTTPQPKARPDAARAPVPVAEPAPASGSAGAPRQVQASDPAPVVAVRAQPGARPADLPDAAAIQGGNNGAPPHALPARSDDAITARRLRRAAEGETDPGLKEKLWREYLEFQRSHAA